MKTIEQISNQAWEQSANDAASKVALGAIALVPFALGAALVANAALLMVGIVTVLLAAMAFVGARLRSQTGRMLVAVALIGQCICITGALSGHPWQLDSHMLFFAALAVCMVMSEPLIIIVAAGTVAVHHLGLSIALPSLVYPSSDLLANLQRVTLHAVILIVEAAVLWTFLRQRNRAFHESYRKNHAIEASAQETKAALADAEAARVDAENALKEAQAARQEALDARRTAEAETEKAVETDRKARKAEEIDRENRAKVEAEQNKVVEALRSALKSLSAGDLSKQIEDQLPERYEDLRQDFNEALTSLNTAMTLVDENAVTIVDDVRSIEAAAETLAKRTEAQAATLEETTAAMSQIALNSNDAAQSAEQANEAAGLAKSKANSSDAVVRSAVSAMAQIEESSGQISKIVRVIEDIAFQTNLLALNAGVEAARAGESGRGFSVVASEVRELAQRSSEAAKEISGLIDASGQQVANGVELVSKAGDALQSINSSIEEISEFVAVIAGATKEQSLSISESNEAMHQLEKVTQQNAAMFEETNAVTQSLAQQSNNLKQAMAKFSVSNKPTPARPQPSSVIHDAKTAKGVSSTSGFSSDFDGSAARAINAEAKLDPGWEEF